ncbi:16S rRNA (cytosine967-C5)-methyltransferase [Filimonas lacunae]|uniref:16S rRNA (Cytosine967-C5)-methyltransferase n=2 Tax=Filimonas lacunae TaxID=477680 RepID=A0A173MAK2_9BACT|nr:ribosomal RNA small subunit methyltransferase B [Filimonas lacunae]SIT32758.1 16S rRNA (cytosine967-C5)-methyltransferase [Filimonas lacunae]
MPLQHYLKQFFAADKKYGSKDRRHITHLCYCYFRSGNALQHLSAEERIRISLYLCSDTLEGWTGLFSEDWVTAHSKEVAQRIAFIQQEGIAFQPGSIFPWLDECSPDMDTAAFTQSHLQQPLVFLRIRPRQEKQVLQVLENNNIVYSRPEQNCIALAPGSKADQLLQINQQVVVQDLSSQRIGSLFTHIHKPGTNQVWDCCAASGGKSILAYDMLPDIRLTVSDVRASIIHNLKQRFVEAGIRNYQSFVADLTSKAGIPRSDMFAGKFDVIICDAPCSGSGTWGRTPEQLTFFTPAQIQQYAILQKQIIATSATAVARNGYFLYITCSVFKKENEEQLAYIQEQTGMQVVASGLYQGFTERADTMYAALFVKS